MNMYILAYRYIYDFTLRYDTFRIPFFTEKFFASLTMWGILLLDWFISIATSVFRLWMSCFWAVKFQPHPMVYLFWKWTDGNPTQSIFTNTPVRSDLSDVHAYYVIVSADKAPNSFVSLCKDYYIDCLVVQLGLNGSTANLMIFWLTNLFNNLLAFLFLLVKKLIKSSDILRFRKLFYQAVIKGFDKILTMVSDDLRQ